MQWLQNYWQKLRNWFFRVSIFSGRSNATPSNSVNSLTLTLHNNIALSRYLLLHMLLTARTIENLKKKLLQFNYKLKSFLPKWCISWCSIGSNPLCPLRPVTLQTHSSLFFNVVVSQAWMWTFYSTIREHILHVRF